jgi:Metallopeptidase family M24
VGRVTVVGLSGADPSRASGLGAGEWAEERVDGRTSAAKEGTSPPQVGDLTSAGLGGSSRTGNDPMTAAEVAQHRGETRPLEPGMCFSIEPGIYLPGRLGGELHDHAGGNVETHAVAISDVNAADCTPQHDCADHEREHERGRLRTRPGAAPRPRRLPGRRSSTTHTETTATTTDQS